MALQANLTLVASRSDGPFDHQDASLFPQLATMLRAGAEGESESRCKVT